MIDRYSRAEKHLKNLSRREFLGRGLGSLALASLLDSSVLSNAFAATASPMEPRLPHFAPKVRNVIFVSWNPPVSGPAVTSYTVWVSGAYVGSVTTAARTLSGAAGPGTYVISVSATNACGTGAATPAQTLVIP